MSVLDRLLEKQDTQILDSLTLAHTTISQELEEWDYNKGRYLKELRNFKKTGKLNWEVFGLTGSSKSLERRSSQKENAPLQAFEVPKRSTRTRKVLTDKLSNVEQTVIIKQEKYSLESNTSEKSKTDNEEMPAPKLPPLKRKKIKKEKLSINSTISNVSVKSENEVVRRTSKRTKKPTSKSTSDRESDVILEGPNIETIALDDSIATTLTNKSDAEEEIPVRSTRTKTIKKKKPVEAEPVKVDEPVGRLTRTKKKLKEDEIRASTQSKKKREEDRDSQELNEQVRQKSKRSRSDKGENQIQNDIVETQERKSDKEKKKSVRKPKDPSMEPERIEETEQIEKTKQVEEVEQINERDKTLETEYEDAVSTLEDKVPEKGIERHELMDKTMIIEKPVYVNNGNVKKPAKKQIEIFSPFDNSPVKKKVEAFEKLVKTKKETTTPLQKTAKEKLKYFTPNPPPTYATRLNYNNSLCMNSPLVGSSVVRSSEKDAAQARKAALLTAKIEEKRRMREEKMARLQKQREEKEKFKQEALEAQQKLKEERRRQLQMEKQEKQQKLVEEVEKKRLLAKKKALEEKKREEALRLEEEKCAVVKNQPPIYMIRKAPRLPTDDCYDSDEEEYANHRPKIPVWSKDRIKSRRELIQLTAGSSIKNSFFRMQAQTVDLAEVFQNRDLRNIKRGSSAVWHDPPRFTYLAPVKE